MISDYRLGIITAKIQELHEQLKIAEYPVKMPALLKQFYSDKIIIKQVEFQGSADVVANYDPVHDVTAIIINKSRTSPRLHKRLNFSLAHELGHIALEHYKFYASTDKAKLDYIEEEANEFAGQFLVPEKQFMIRPYDIHWLSDIFFVSTEVIQKRYLNINKINNSSKSDKKLDMIIDRYLFDV
jgi:Zn-dependent peptidase ImmA (M78 family)